MTLADRGLDFKVEFVSATVTNPNGIFDATVKQLMGFTAGAEIDTDTDDEDLVTKQSTLGKPTLQNIQVTTQANPALQDLLLTSSSANELGTLTIDSAISGDEGQSIANVHVSSCEIDTVENEAFPTMTITFMPQGGVTANSPATT